MIHLENFLLDIQVKYLMKFIISVAVVSESLLLSDDSESQKRQQVVVELCLLEPELVGEVGVGVTLIPQRDLLFPVNICYVASK